MMMNDGVDDEIEDFGNHFHNKWFWHSGTVMMMNDGVDDEIEDFGNHFHNKMVLKFQYGDDDGDDDERRC